MILSFWVLVVSLTLNHIASRHPEPFLWPAANDSFDGRGYCYKEI